MVHISGLVERVAGSLNGMYIGDSIGQRFTSKNIKECRSFKENLMMSADVSDDCKMVIILLKSITSKDAIEQKCIAESFIRWFNAGKCLNAGIGVAASLSGADNASDCIKNASKYNLPNFSAECLLKIVPIAMYFSNACNFEIEDVRSACEFVVDLTHPFDFVKETCFAFALILIQIYQGKSLSKSINFATTKIKSKDVLDNLSIIKDASIFNSDYFQPHLHQIRYCISTAFVLSLSIMNVAKPDWNFEKILFHTIKFGGNVNINLAIVGTLYGAINGRISLPLQFLEQIEQIENNVLNENLDKLCRDLLYLQSEK